VHSIYLVKRFLVALTLSSLILIELLDGIKVFVKLAFDFKYFVGFENSILDSKIVASMNL